MPAHDRVLVQVLVFPRRLRSFGPQMVAQEARTSAWKARLASLK
jgi:hypothetical protein